MNRSPKLALLAGALLAVAVTAGAVPPAHAASTTAPAIPSKPVVERPQANADVDRILTAMNNASTWGHPDLFGEYAGMRLYFEGHYQAAIKYFQYGARYADKLSQLSIGLMYENGRGVEKDPVTACAWLALAAQRKFPSFVATRNRVCEALTPAQHDQAVAVLDKLLPVYGDKVAKKRMTDALRLAKMETTGSRLGFDSGITTVGVNQNCGGPTTTTAGVPVPVAGCGSTNFWSPERWDSKQYFQMRDARWRGVVTVGSLEQQSHAHVKAANRKQPASAPPASASSTDH
ncbi:MAG: sel1 repeat family protein [Rhodanobacteraceae bacterium]